MLVYILSAAPFFGGTGRMLTAVYYSIFFSITVLVYWCVWVKKLCQKRTPDPGVLLRDITNQRTGCLSAFDVSLIFRSYLFLLGHGPEIATDPAMDGSGTNCQKVSLTIYIILCSTVVSVQRKGPSLFFVHLYSQV
jgi:hypothetical protein